MANRYTIASGLSSAPSTWDGGVSVPVEGDRRLVCAGHDVTLDGHETWGDDLYSTIVINGVSTTRSITILGSLTYSRATSSSLTCKGHIYVGPTGKIDKGTQASPIPSGVTAALILNKSATLAGMKYGLVVDSGGIFCAYGATKDRIATLGGARSAGSTALVAHYPNGWQAGDSLYLANTQTVADRHEVVTIQSISGTDITLTSGLLYAHADKCPIANLTSNVTIKNFSQSYRGTVDFRSGAASLANTSELGYCTFDNIGTSYPLYGVSFGATTNYTANPFISPYKPLESVAFISRTTSPAARFAGGGSGMEGINDAPIVSNNCAFINTYTGDTQTLLDNGWETYTGCLMAGNCPITCSSLIGSTLTNCWIASTRMGLYGIGRNYRFTGSIYSGSSYGNGLCANTSPSLANAEFESCDIAESFPRSAYPVVKLQSTGTPITVTFKNCYQGALVTVDASEQKIMSGGSFVKVINKNRDITLQEEFVPTGSMVRENALKYRGASSAKMTPAQADKPYSKSFEIQIGAGETIRLIGYCQYDLAYYNMGTGFVAPTLTLSGTIAGVSLTPATYTATVADAGNWDLIDLSITNPTAYPGSIAATMSVQSAVTTGAVYWDGIPFERMVEVVRHYGFLSDPSNPKRIIDPLTLLSEAEALSLTGLDLDFGTNTLTITESRSAREIYDFIYAMISDDISQPEKFTSSDGLNFACGYNIILDGGSITGSGAIVMAANTLTVSNGGSSALPIAHNAGVFTRVRVSGFLVGSALHISDMETGVVMYNTIPASGEFVLPLNWTHNKIVRIRVEYCIGLTAKLPIERFVLLGPSGIDELVTQQPNHVYEANGIDGSTVDEYSAQYLQVMVDVSATAGKTTVQRGYAWYCNVMMYPAAMDGYFGAMTADDRANYCIHSELLDLKIKNTSTVPMIMSGARLYRTDGESVFAPGGPIEIDSGRREVVDVPSAAANAAAVRAEMERSGGLLHALPTLLEIEGSAVLSREASVTTIISATEIIKDRLPAALVGGKMDSSTPIAPTPEETALAVWGKPVEGAYTAEEVLKIMASVLGGKVSGAGTGVEVFRDISDVKNRVSISADKFGNRTAVEINAE